MTTITLTHPAREPISSHELDDVVCGFVTAATWADLERPPECGTCGAPLAPTFDGASETWACAEHGDMTEHARYQIEIGANRGSHPDEYGPDDLTPESRARVREMVSGWLDGVRADARAFVGRVGPIFDPSKGAECSGWERLGHSLYLTSNEHGAGFMDYCEGAYREESRQIAYFGSLERLRAINAQRASWNAVLDRLSSYSGCGVDSVELMADGSIEISG